MRLALAQLNVIVGDLAGNSARIVAAIGEARAAGADLVVFPELAVTGYPPEDLLLRPGFVKAARTALDEIATATGDITALVGCPLFDRDLANACAVMPNGELLGVYRKQFLPNYGVFDEHRYFAEGRELVLLHTGDVLIGPTICEDIWQPGPPATDLALAGAQLIVNLSASPYHVGKAEEREEMLVTRARDNASYLAFCNLVGGQDELVFDGHSVVLDDEGERHRPRPGLRGGAPRRRRRSDRGDRPALARRTPPELERSRERMPDVTMSSCPHRGRRLPPLPATVAPFKPGLEQMRLALGLGVRDYVEKNGFREVVLGISGGIDSALTAAICADALGPQRVHTVSMPSRFSSAGTRDDARAAEREPRRRLPRDPDRGGARRVHGGARSVVRRPHARPDRGEPAGRTRGTLLMALSNKFGWLVRLDREQVGAGGRLRDAVRGHGGRLRPAQGRVQDGCVPARAPSQRQRRPRAHPPATIERPPSAELRADQRDDQSLPPYDLLDPVLEAYVELDRSREELLAEFDAATVEKALALVDRAEYKRRQAPPGVKLRPAGVRARLAAADHEALAGLIQTPASIGSGGGPSRRSAATSSGSRPGAKAASERSSSSSVHHRSSNTYSACSCAHESVGLGVNDSVRTRWYCSC